MDNKVIFDKQLINRYDTAGPRYTSYPTALQFSAAYDGLDYREWVKDSNDDPIPSPLSLSGTFQGRTLFTRHLISSSIYLY